MTGTPATSSTAPSLSGADAAALRELAPVLRRAQSLDPRSLARFRIGPGTAAVLVRLPFGVLVSRTVQVAQDHERLDVAVRAVEVLAWLDGEHPDPPRPRDADWRTGLPPVAGWTQLETVPVDVVRSLVRAGATALTDAAAREGVPGAQPRAEVADALLDSVVLTVDDEAGARAGITLRALGALTRMGFLPRDGRIRVDVSGRWIRVVAEYGTVYLERPGTGLLLR